MEIALNAWRVMNQYDRGAVMQISTMFRAANNVACRIGLLKRGLLDIYLTTSFAVCNLQNT